MTPATVSANRFKKRAKKAAKTVIEDHGRLVRRIRNLFERERWSNERIAEVIELPRSEVIRLIQSSQLDQ